MISVNKRNLTTQLNTLRMALFFMLILITCIGFRIDDYISCISPNFKLLVADREVKDFQLQGEKAMSLINSLDQLISGGH